MKVANTYGMDSLHPFSLDRVVGGFFCQLHKVFADVKVLLEGRKLLKHLDTLLTRNYLAFFFCL